MREQAGNAVRRGQFQRGSRQTPAAAAEVEQQSGIAQDLKLLADFVADEV
jgi:inorganic triphosphatase YgiF